MAGGEGAAGLNEATLDGRGERGAGAATPTQRRNGEGVREGGGQAGKFGGPVDDFREKVSKRKEGRNEHVCLCCCVCMV